MTDYDVVLKSLGGTGIYHILVFACLGYFAIPGGMNDAAPVFISYRPKYRCKVYPFDDSELYPNLSRNEIWNITTPLDREWEPIDACVRYGYNSSNCAGDGDITCVNKSLSTVKCDEYYYSQSVLTKTAVTEFDLVCDRSFLKSLANAVYLGGFLLGAAFSGYLSDRYGRKMTSIGCGYAMVLTMLTCVFSTSVEFFMVCRFLLGAFTMGTHLAIFTHITELVGNKWRTVAGMGYRMCYALGYMTWSLVAYLFRDWREMQFGSFLLAIPFAFIIVFVPESPRWLFTNGHDKRGMKVVSTMAKLNKVPIPEDVLGATENSERNFTSNKDVAYSVRDLFRFPGLRTVTLKIGFTWFVDSMLYYGILLNTGSLAGDLFLNNVFGSLLEIASLIVCILIMDRIGRRLLLSICLAGAGLALFGSAMVKEKAFSEPTLNTLALVLAFIAKSFASGSYAIIYNFASELYPTVVRSNGIGFGSVCAQVGSIISPFVISIQGHIRWAPSTIFAVFAVAGALLSLTFRDTTGRNMMETIDEAEIFYAGKEITKQTNPSGTDNHSSQSDNRLQDIATVS